MEIKTDEVINELTKRYIDKIDIKIPNTSERTINKVSQQIVSLCKKYGITDIEMMIMFNSMSQTIFSSFITNFYINNKEKKDILGYSNYLFEQVDYITLKRTQMASLIDSFYKVNQKNFDLGNNYNYSINLKYRFEVLKKYNFCCKYCGRKPPQVELELELEHIIPKCCGGTDNSDNLAPACRDCNRGKSGSILEL